jgi:hypothetical protein
MAPKGSAMADQDDLPPRTGYEPDVEEPSFFESLGELFGASVWLVLFLAIVGIGLFLFLRATH